MSAVEQHAAWDINGTWLLEQRGPWSLNRERRMNNERERRVAAEKRYPSEITEIILMMYGWMYAAGFPYSWRFTGVSDDHAYM